LPTVAFCLSFPIGSANLMVSQEVTRLIFLFSPPSSIQDQSSDFSWKISFFSETKPPLSCYNGEFVPFFNN
jgi:hypothetical protein